MDQQLRDIERNYRANPKDKNLLRQLVVTRRRIGYLLQTSEDLALDQEEICLRHREVQEESRNSYKKFEKFYASLFVEYPALERITIRLWLPEFMDGDALRPDRTVMVSPRSYANWGLLSFDEVYENWSDENDRANKLIQKTSCVNGNLSEADAEKIMNQLWVFGEHIDYRFGLNVQVDIYRHPGPAPDSDTSRIHADGMLALEIQPYECGY